MPHIDIEGQYHRDMLQLAQDTLNWRVLLLDRKEKYNRMQNKSCEIIGKKEDCYQQLGLLSHVNSPEGEG